MPSESDGSDVAAQLDRAFRGAIVATLSAAPEDAPSIDVGIRASQNPQFGDYQCNAALGLAKRAGSNPRELAQQIVAAAQPLLGELTLPLEVAGPGFINIRLRPEALARQLESMDDAALGVRPVVAKHAIVIDLCGVNVAKQLHVGHLRATIIGDTLARVHERLGRKVWRENHLGDWGLPIAMVLHALRQRGVPLDSLSLDDLNNAYRDAQASIADPTFEQAAKATLVALQSGDPDLRRDWQAIIEVTMREVFACAAILNCKVGPEHSRGESFYRERLAGVVEAFVRAGLAKEDDGAIVVPFADRERPLLIRKRDGGFLYATTDLAGVRFRVQELDGERVVYVVDARQRDHFRDVFDAARLIGWETLGDGQHAELTHVGFGTVLGVDRKPLKTRSGENVTLMSLLTEAVERGQAEVRRRASDPDSPTHGMTDAELDAIGRAVGIAAIKYADLGTDLVKDYAFDLDRMVAFEGDTGPYLLYAHARICSILSKAADAAGSKAADAAGSKAADAAYADTPILLREPAERLLALALLRYPQVLLDVARTLEPHRLCAYLRTLAEQFSGFYNTCPVLKADDEATRRSRLRLCDLTRRVLRDGLDVLGIEAPQRM